PIRHPLLLVRTHASIVGVHALQSISGKSRSGCHSAMPVPEKYLRLSRKPTRSNRLPATIKLFVILLLGRGCGSSALQALGHLSAVIREVLRQVRWTYPALPVSRDGIVDKRRVRQVQVGHDGLEFLQRLAATETGISLF